MFRVAGCARYGLNESGQCVRGSMLNCQKLLGRRRSAFDWIEAFIMGRFDGEHHGGGSSRSLAAVGGVQGFFSEYSLFLIVLFAAVIVVFLSIILALAVYICKAGPTRDSLLLP